MPASPLSAQGILIPWRSVAPPHSNIGKCLPPPTSRFFLGKSPAVSHKEKWPLGTLAFFHVWKSPSLLRIQFWHPGVSRKFQIHSPSKQPSVLTVNLSFILKYQNFNGRRSGGGGHFFIKDSTKDSKRQKQLSMLLYTFLWFSTPNLRG